jgi:hypothetical protein
MIRDHGKKYVKKNTRLFMGSLFGTAKQEILKLGTGKSLSLDRLSRAPY